MAGTLLAPLHMDYLSPCSPTHQKVISKVQRCFILLFGNAPTMCKMTKVLHGNNFVPGRICIFLSVYYVFSELGRYESNLWVLVGTCRVLLKCNSLQQLSALWMNFKTILWVPVRLLLGQNT